METENQQSETSQHERRTDVRIAVNVPVEITTIYHKGIEIKERTYIEDVSDQGCRFTMRGAIRKGDTFSVRLLAPDGQILLSEPAKIFEVMWIARGSSILVVGARIIDGEKFDRVKILEKSVDRQAAANR